MSKPILSVNNLSIAVREGKTMRPIVSECTFDLLENEILGIVGESGSGKSVTSLALMGLLPKGILSCTEGTIEFRGKNITNLPEKKWENIRGKVISMIFQEPMSSLNPSMKCGKQVAEILERHTDLSANDIKKEVLLLFEKVKIPLPETTFHKYPHQLSGGQKQRVMIAMAIACKPQLLIADEPTTALDVTVQKEIIQLLKELQKETKMSILFISHDLALVSEIAQKVMVMYQGKIVEKGAVSAIFRNPQKDYTKALIGSRPQLGNRLKRLPTIKDFLTDDFEPVYIEAEERKKNHQKLYQNQPLLEIVDLEKEYIDNAGLFSKKSFMAVNKVSFKIYEGETLGLVGESGCGKSTLGNALLLLDPPTAGQVFYQGKDITQLSSKEVKKLRKDLQIIFQDPYSSLNPRIPVGKAIMEPMQVHRLYKNDKERKQKTIEILEKVGLSAEHFDRYPHEFSGGQRQRIGIARTVAVNPKLIVCDESVSALDISVQAQVLNLLNDLKEFFGFTYIFISHDLSVVKYMSDEVMVMQKGQIVEKKEADNLYQSPEKEYTKTLINAIPKGL